MKIITNTNSKVYLDANGKALLTPPASGTISIEHNNPSVNVSDYATANVEVKNYIQGPTQIDFTITPNCYYAGGSNPNPIAYNGWDCTNIVDATGYTLFAATTGSSLWPAYSYYNSSTAPASLNASFTYNNDTYYIFKLNANTAFGFSNVRSTIAKYKYLFISNYEIVDAIIQFN